MFLRGVFQKHVRGTLWNSTRNILPIHWKICFLYNTEILRALRFKRSYMFLKRPPPPPPLRNIHLYGGTNFLRKRVNGPSFQMSMDQCQVWVQLSGAMEIGFLFSLCCILVLRDDLKKNISEGSFMTGNPLWLTVCWILTHWTLKDVAVMWNV